MKMTILKDFIRDESGATAIEYGIIAGMMAAVIITAISLVGDQLMALFTSSEDSIAGAIEGALKS